MTELVEQPELHTLMMRVLMQLLRETIQQYLLKLSVHIPYDLAILSLSMYPREVHICAREKVHGSIFVIGRNYEQLSHLTAE